METWAQIPEFNEYSVSNRGFVRRDTTGRIININRNQFGACYVSMVGYRRQYTRAVALLVADAFLPRPKYSTWNTPIHLNGKREENHVENLMWRPLWFARKYQAQFSKWIPDNIYVEDLATEEVYSVLEAATTFGLLVEELLSKPESELAVTPTLQRFRYV